MCALLSGVKHVRIVVWSETYALLSIVTHVCHALLSIVHCCLYKRMHCCL